MPAPGVGDAETCHFSTAVKYRANVGPVRVGALWQFGGYELNNGSNGAGQFQLGGDIYNLGFGTLSLDGIYSYVRDAVALGLTGGTTNASGMPIAPFPGQTLTATISNNQSVMLLAKYTVGGLRLYAGYEWVQFAPPSDPQTAFTNIAGLPMGAAFGNGTAIDNVAFSAGRGGNRLQRQDFADRVDRREIHDHSRLGCDRRLLSLHPEHVHQRELR